MPRACKICRHVNHEAIDQGLVSGTPYRTVAKRFGASPPSVFRHLQGHLPATLLRAKDAQEVAHADSLLDQVRTLQYQALRIYAKADEAGDLRTALAALSEMRDGVELVAKLTGQSTVQDNLPYPYLSEEQLEGLQELCRVIDQQNGSAAPSTVETAGYASEAEQAETTGVILGSPVRYRRPAWRASKG